MVWKTPCRSITPPRVFDAFAAEKGKDGWFSGPNDGRKISVSLATFEFKAKGSDAHPIMTEQGAFLDGYGDAGSRERGSQEIMGKLGAYLEGVG